MKFRSVILVVCMAAVFGISGYLAFHYQSQKNFSSLDATVTAVPAASDSPTTPVASTSAVVAPTGNVDGSNSAASPDLSVDAEGLSKATVTITTSKGVIRFKFYSDDAPNTTRRIAELIEQKFYDGVLFHRVVPQFVIQTGDPTGTGTGGSGQRLKSEFNQRRHNEGAVAMARAADPDSADSQFYITILPQHQLNQSYTVFGQVIEGMDVVRNVRVGDKMLNVVVN